MVVYFVPSLLDAVSKLAFFLRELGVSDWLLCQPVQAKCRAVLLLTLVLIRSWQSWHQHKKKTSKYNVLLFTVYRLVLSSSDTQKTLNLYCFCIGPDTACSRTESQSQRLLNVLDFHFLVGIQRYCLLLRYRMSRCEVEREKEGEKRSG